MYKRQGKDPVAAAAEAAGGYVLAKTKMVKKEGKTIDGLYYGTLELEADPPGKFFYLQVACGNNVKSEAVKTNIFIKSKASRDVYKRQG